MTSWGLALSTARAARSRACTATQTLAAKRTFSSLPHLRPSILAPKSAIFRPCNSANTLLSRLPTTTALPADISSASEGVADIVPKSAITTHPALAGPQQIRCGPRPNLATSSRLVRRRRIGFLSRMKTREGRKILEGKRKKGRKHMGRA